MNGSLRRFVGIALVAWVAISILITPGAKASGDFNQWLADYYPEAKRQGISEQTWKKAFADINSPDRKVLKKAAYQPEFTLKIWEYLDTRVNPLALRRGKNMAERHMATFTLLEKKFGISRYVLLAIWSMETNYGLVLQRPERLHYVPRALATLAWGDSKRSKFARSQLIAALKILQAGDIGYGQMLGSWAGAMGHTQFIPTSYLAYSVDMDGDGRRDIWNSIPDALATAANLLVKNGWRSGRTWGYEVLLPPNAQQFNEQTKTLREWQQLGFLRPGGKPYPRAGEKAVLKILAGGKGPGFLMVKNFFVLKRYNNSDFYALGVGLLADRLAGWHGMVQKWPRPPGSLSAAEKVELQQLLKARGMYHGEIDGNIGKGSREAIMVFQKRIGMQRQDGKPTREVLEALR